MFFNSTYSKDPHLIHKIRILVFLAARFDFCFQAIHIKGKFNSQADALSCNNPDHFLSQSGPMSNLFRYPSSSDGSPGNHPRLDISSMDCFVQQDAIAALREEHNKL